LLILGCLAAVVLLPVFVVALPILLIGGVLLAIVLVPCALVAKALF